MTTALGAILTTQGMSRCFTFTADPTVNDDTGDGYVIGDVWLNTTNDSVWQVLDVTAGAAVWKQLDGSGSGSIAAYEDGASVVASADKFDFKDTNIEDGGSNDVHVYMDMPDLCQGRLTLTTAVPVTTSDVTGATTVYFTPYNGDWISLYDGTRWKRFRFTEKSLSLASHIKGVCYDIFLYDNAGTLTLESLAWKKVAASNSPTAGANKTINLADTATLAVGMEVTVKDGTNSEVTNITAVVASTSITVDNLANGYTTPDVYGYQARATALVDQNGVKVKSGATTRRFLGTLRINRTNTGQCEDTDKERFCVNYYNRIRKQLIAGDTSDTWTYASATVRAANASVVYGVARVGIVIPLQDYFVEICNLQSYAGSAAANVTIGIGLDTTTTNVAKTLASTVAASGRTVGEGLYAAHPSIGNHYLQCLEATSAGTLTFLGDAALATGLFQTGFSGVVEC